MPEPGVVSVKAIPATGEPVISHDQFFRMRVLFAAGHPLGLKKSQHNLFCRRFHLSVSDLYAVMPADFFAKLRYSAVYGNLSLRTASVRFSPGAYPVHGKIFIYSNLRFVHSFIIAEAL